MRKVYVGIGSNLGDREFLIRKAVEACLLYTSDAADE